jgi:putative ABC transport system permease protein
MFSDLRFRLRALFRRNAMERELDAELRFHLEREIEKYVRAGMSRADAERRARISFGGVDRIKDDARDARGVQLIDSLRQDLRYAWRSLVSTPGFTAAVVLTLGLGIAANTAMFGIVDRLLFRPPAYLTDADRTHRVYLRNWTALSEQIDRNIEYTRYADLVRWTTSFDRATAFGYRSLPVGTGDDAREMNVAAVSASFFNFFSARPELGRFFLPDEDVTPVGSSVVVLAHAFWQTQFAGAKDVVGKQLAIGDHQYTIVGVAPEHFVGVTELQTPVAFIPITTFAFRRSQAYYKSYNWSWLEVLVHRKRDVSIAAANADLTAAYLRSWAAESDLGPVVPVDSARPRGEIGPIHMARGPQASMDSRIVTWVAGVAFIVLLIACANVANLLLTRALKRRREMALRLALGVTRRRLLQQLATESLLLALLGGTAGVLAAQWGGGVLRALYLRPEDARAVIVDLRTMMFVGLITMAVAVITGLAPAANAFRADLAEALKSGSREGTYRKSRLRTSLLVFQGTLSVVLLVGAGLFVKSLRNVQARRLGYDIAPIVYASGTLRGVQLNPAERNALSERMLEAARTVPGVRSATLTISVPFWSNEGRGVPFVPGVDSIRKLGRFLLQAGSPEYFETMGTRIVHGRRFTEADRAGSPRVIIVSESMARAIWPGQDPLGKQIRIGGDTVPFSTVVGVAETMRARLFQGGDTEHWYFFPIAQYVASYGTADPEVFARVEGDPKDVAEPLRRRLQRELPGASYVTVRPLERIVTPQAQSWRFGATMFVAFGGLALVLAAIGLYSVIAYGVAQRTHELGVRIALGASVGDVTRMVVGQGMAFALAGIAIGGLIAFWAGKWVEPLLFAQKARDPLVFGGVATVLLLVAVVATLRPAIRATRVDPTVALRAD